MKYMWKLLLYMGLFILDIPAKSTSGKKVEGGWSAWGTWEECVGICGEFGQHMRVRTCTNPTPVAGGMSCRGESKEVEACPIKVCSWVEYENLVRSDETRKLQYELATAEHKRHPELMQKCITSKCSFQFVRDIIKDNRTTMAYWNAIHCVKHNVGCPEFNGSPLRNLILVVNLVLIILVASIFGHTYLHRKDKFGLYQHHMRRRRNIMLIPDEEMEYLIEHAESPQGLDILGSPEDVERSVVRLRSRKEHLRAEADIPNMELPPMRPRVREPLDRLWAV